MRKAPALFLLLAALAAAGCGDDGEESGDLRALPGSSCDSVEYEGEGKPDVLIASDLPMQGDAKERSNQMVEAIRLALERRDWRAGGERVGFQACDDSTAKAGEWTEEKCKANAKAYSENRDVVGVLGTYNSGCAALMIPVLNGAPGGSLAIVSPGNTLICLTETSDTCEGGQPDSLYPEKKRNYARVVPNDAFQGAGLATFARQQKLKQVFVLYAAHDPTSLGQAETFRNAAKPLGLDVAGFEQWDPKAKSYTGLMKKAKAAGADGVVLAGLTEQNGGRLIKDKVDVLGPNDGRVKLLAPDGFAQQSTIDEGGSASRGMLVSVPGRAPENLTGTGKSFVTELEKRLEGKPVELYAPYAGQAADVLLDAIAAGKGKRAEIVRGLYETDIRDGIVGSFRIEPSGDPDRGFVTVFSAAKEFEPVEEIEPPSDLVKAARG